MIFLPPRLFLNDGNTWRKQKYFSVTIDIYKHTFKNQECYLITKTTLFTLS